MRLEELVREAAARTPDKLAVCAHDGTLSYGTLDRRADQLAHQLRDMGVTANDRVAFWLDKGCAGVVTTQAALRLGAAYVPVDPMSPPDRAGRILVDCDVSALITTRARLTALVAEGLVLPPVLLVDESWHALDSQDPSAVFPATRDPDALAYILYTSGSTGSPKGVCISHRNALAFVEWAVDTLEASPQDRFANHAPFHFDLSVLDLYGAFWAGASVHLIPEAMAYFPARLLEYVKSERITLWYSVPSVLILMIERAGMIEVELPDLRSICFAGEPFPIKYVRRIRDRWPELRLLNLYGPTETNVCTFHEVFEVDPERTGPPPIGRICSDNDGWVLREDGQRAGVGEEGELIIDGPTVMLGYWGGKPQTGPYATGDIVRVLEDGSYDLIGRRDHMVKVRGHRIEPGEIESALQSHPSIRDVAVVVQGHGMQAQLVAHIVPTEPGKPPRLLALKRHSSERLPRYMIPHRCVIHRELPRTSSGKTDRVNLTHIPA